MAQKETALVKKLINILDVSNKVNKSGYNAHQRYHYITEADLLDVIRKELVKQGIFVFTSVEDAATERIEGSKQPVLTTVKMKHTFVDRDSDEQFTVYSYGQGVDSADKGIFKAITGASKYFLLKTFMLSGDDDPENDGETALGNNSKISLGFGGKAPNKTGGKSKNSNFGGKSTASKFGSKKQSSPKEEETEEVTEEVEESPQKKTIKGFGRSKTVSGKKPGFGQSNKSKFGAKKQVVEAAEETPTEVLDIYQQDEDEEF